MGLVIPSVHHTHHNGKSPRYCAYLPASLHPTANLAEGLYRPALLPIPSGPSRHVTPVMRLFLLLLLLTLPIRSSSAQIIDDVKVQYARMSIQAAQLSETDLTVDFTRHLVDMVFGRGPVTVGLTFQQAVKENNDPLPPALAHSEHGFMLTAGYDAVLSPRWRVETYARVGLGGGTDPGHALYATDTDMRVNVVAFEPDGWGLLAGRPLFPSAYAGGVVNRYGRVQAIGGAGLWWNSIGTYITAFSALNGVDDPLATLQSGGPEAPYLFAALSNAGMSGSVSIERGPFQVGLRRNIALRNGGDDLTLWAAYRYTLRQGGIL